jgi:branched-chain amino acid transport system permease protein
LCGGRPADADPIAQTLVNGLLLGSNYALLAIGYTLVFGVTRLLTLAHGDVFMVSGLLAVLAMNELGVPFTLAILIALVAGTAAGIATDLLCFRPVPRTSELAPAVATIGFALILQDSVVVLRGSSNPVGLPGDVGASDIHLGPILISVAQLTMLVLAVVLMVAIQWFVSRTRWGMAMRAMAENATAVQLCGVNPRTLGTAVLAAAGFLAGIASILVALRIGSVSPFAGLEIGIIGLAIITVAGLGSVTGAMVAGLSIGMIEVFADHIGFGGLDAAIPWLFVILVLLVRPQGLFSAGQR